MDRFLLYRIMTPAFRLFAFFLFFGALSSLAFAEGRYALVIGVDRYEYLDEHNQLDVAVEDAELIARTLEALEPSFEVTLRTNVGQDEAEDALDEFIDAADGAECALIYFAGHGIEYYGDNFLLVSDTEIEKISDDVPRMKRRLGNEALSLQAWVDSLDTTDAGVKIVILDACRDNPLQAVGSSGTRSIVGGKGGLAQVTPPSGSLISYSADAGQRANDGLFTKILSEKLITPGLPLLEVFASTREEVLKLSTKLEKADQGVRHEPAEYTKLNLAGTRFSFLPAGGDTGEQLGGGDGATEEMVRLRLELEKLKREMSVGGAPPTESPEPALSAAYRSLAGKTPGEEKGFPGATMIWCPPTGPEGFAMGSPETERFRRSNEEQRQVILTRGFWLAKFECTQGTWTSLMNSNPSHIQGDSWGPMMPVEKVSWSDAQEFLKRMNTRYPLGKGWKWDLPTEAQWEYACRAGTMTPYWTGDSITRNDGNYDVETPDDGTRQTTHRNMTKKVGSYRPNPWGFYDMEGNVSEMCGDGYQQAGFLEQQTDPVGPEGAEYTVVRGGSFYHGYFQCRSAHRNATSPDATSTAMGFRLAIVPVD